MSAFEQGYADAYDIVYRDKNYAEECAVFTKLIDRYGDGHVRKLLNLGCGTGRHDLAFHDKGYQVTGVDRSAAMLAHARTAAAERGAPIEFLEGDARTFRCGDKFDATLMMFNVLGYMPTTQDMLQALATARHHTRPGGLFIADVWYGPAVLKDGPGSQFREIPNGEERLLRFSSGRLDTRAQTSQIDLRVLRIAGDRVVADTHETHLMRYFFPTEIDLALRLSGFRLTALQGFPEIDAPVSDGKWLCVIVATADDAGPGLRPVADGTRA